jgi:hypothetical protein
MKVFVPVLVDVKGLVARLDVSPTKSKNLKNRIYYLLSKIMVHNENIDLYAKNNYFRNICSKSMKDIIGNKDFNLIMKLLRDSLDPIIEGDNSYSNFEDNIYCKGYRLVDKYNSGIGVYKELDRKFSNKVSKYLPENPEKLMLEQRYSFILQQYKLHQLEFHPTVIDFIQDFGIQLLKDTKNKFQRAAIHNQIGSWLSSINRFSYKELNPMISASNHRLNSGFTNLPKLLRPFVLCNGQSLISIDIKASQPYVLSKLMMNKFFSENKEGFNLNTIYNELYNIIFNDMTMVEVLDSIPFMWGKFFDQNELLDFDRYRNISFESDFYTQTILSSYSGGITEAELIDKRLKFKNSIMFLLFDDDRSRRSTFPSMQFLKSAYPGVNKWIELTHSSIGKKKFALILQRAESYLLLNKVCREFNQLNPEAPFFTIHDSVFTTENYEIPLIQSFQKCCKEVIGINPGLKVDKPVRNSNVTDVDVKSVWNQLKKISTEELFQKNKRQFLSINIKTGENFMKNAA